jgi:hypothetical protein
MRRYVGIRALKRASAQSSDGRLKPRAGPMTPRVCIDLMVRTRSASRRALSGRHGKAPVILDRELHRAGRQHDPGRSRDERRHSEHGPTAEL